MNIVGISFGIGLLLVFIAIHVHLFSVSRFEYSPLVESDRSQNIMDNTNAKMDATLLNFAVRNKNVEQENENELVLVEAATQTKFPVNGTLPHDEENKEIKTENINNTELKRNDTGNKLEDKGGDDRRKELKPIDQNLNTKQNAGKPSIEDRKEITTKKEATNHPIPMEVRLIKNIPNPCENGTLKYIVYVHTSPPNEKRREFVRKSWGNAKLFQDGRFRVVFMMGLPANQQQQEVIDREHAQYGDIVQGDFMDTYHNLTLKGLMGLNWVSKYCGKTKFVLKADDDAFVNIFSLFDILDSNPGNPKTVMCYRWVGMGILRDPKTCMKWCVDDSEFPGQTMYPPYCSGLAYVMSTDIIARMYSVSRDTPFFWVDDVYITGLLLGKIENVTYVHLEDRLTADEKRAADDYLSETATMKYIFSHVHNEATWFAMWNACLAKVPDRYLMNFDKSMIERNPSLQDRWLKLTQHN